MVQLYLAMGILREACQCSDKEARNIVSVFTPPGHNAVWLIRGGLSCTPGIDGQHGSGNVFRLIPKQKLDGVRNVFDDWQSLKRAASGNLTSLLDAYLPGHVSVDA